MNPVLNSEQWINAVNSLIPEDYQIRDQTGPE
jgi:hypothetical protein